MSYSQVHPSLDQALRLFETGNLLPVYRLLPADLETPVSVFLKLFDEQQPAFLLESVLGGEQVNRYSFIGIQPRRMFIADGRNNPLEAIRDELRRYQAIPLPDLPRLTGGAVGYLSYDLIRQFEPIPDKTLNDVHLPESMFMLFDSVVIFDHVKPRLIVLVNAHHTGDPQAAYEGAVARIDSLIERLRRPTPLIATTNQPLDANFESTFTQSEFEAAVERAKEYICAGDAFQIVLSQRLSRQTTASQIAIYRALRLLNPSPYMFLLHYPATEKHPTVSVVGASPEMLVRLEDGIAHVRPIAGTRKRGATPQEDEALAQDLLADPKERAEHIMLVDLGRNDLGRVCDYGTVTVSDMMVVERYSHVMHIVSHVTGKLRPGLDAFDLLAAAFPAGTVSGAPKIRAMQIIDELEKTRRNIYAGGIGYFSFSGAMDTCIAIRTLVKVGDKVYVQAGAGIVADSNPASEYQECLNKARALAEAVKLAESDF
jgi:anthranilate synthase component 1